MNDSRAMHYAFKQEPPPPCDGCEFHDACAKRGGVCASFRFYLATARNGYRPRVPDGTLAEYTATQARLEAREEARRAAQLQRSATQ